MRHPLGRGNPSGLCYAAKLSLIRFLSSPVRAMICSSDQREYPSLLVFPGDLTCFRPCWEAPGSHGPNHPGLTPHASLACVQSSPLAKKGFSWTRGAGKEERLSTTSQGSLPAGAVPPSTRQSRMGPLGLWLGGRGWLWPGVTGLLWGWAVSHAHTHCTWC